jgi:hypothetical protein
VGSSYSLSWKAQDGRTLNYTLRTEAGEGPLALLKLRNFRLPETIFSTTGIALSDQAPVRPVIQRRYTDEHAQCLTQRLPDRAGTTACRNP